MTRRNLLLECALEYCADGWSVIPLCPPNHDGPIPASHRCGHGRTGKAPLVEWRIAQRSRADREDIKRWWHHWPAANIGVVMGRISGIVAWDVDDEEGFAELARLSKDELGNPWTFETGGGGVRYVYSWPGDGPLPPAHFKTSGKNLTFLGERSYSVMPPSNHASGGRYSWFENNDRMTTRPSVLPEPLLMSLLAKKIPNRGPVGGGVELPEHKRNCAKASFMKRCRAWARNFSRAVSGQGGRVVAFKLACSLIHGFGLTPEDAFKIMWEEWNPSCSPPWNEGELWQRVRSAAETGTYTPIEER